MKINEILKEFTSGSVAAISTPLGSSLYKNPSIYDNVGSYSTYNDSKKKKKKTKYNKTKDKE